jgi:hypothetical protein
MVKAIRIAVAFRKLKSSARSTPILCQKTSAVIDCGKRNLKPKEITMSTFGVVRSAKEETSRCNTLGIPQLSMKRSNPVRGQNLGKLLSAAGFQLPKFQKRAK